MRNTATRNPATRPSNRSAETTIALTAAELVRLLRRSAMRIEERGGYLARLAPYGSTAGRRSLRRSSASYAADARLLRHLARQVAADAPHSVPLATAADTSMRTASRSASTAGATPR